MCVLNFYLPTKPQFIPPKNDNEYLKLKLLNLIKYLYLQPELMIIAVNKGE